MNPTPTLTDQRPYHVVTLGFISLYFKELQAAIAFYSQVFGAPDSVDETLQIYGWHMGATWLTLLPSRASTHPESNPLNTEFAIQVGQCSKKSSLPPRCRRSWMPVIVFW